MLQNSIEKIGEYQIGGLIKMASVEKMKHEIDKDMKKKMERLREMREVKRMPRQEPPQQFVQRPNPVDRMNGESFDRIVSRLRTIPLTHNTLGVTELPDNFEPKGQETADDIARTIP